MMNVQENLLATLSEEAGELIQALGKCQRFGLNHLWKSKGLINREAVIHEFIDVLVVWHMLHDKGLVPSWTELQTNPQYIAYASAKHKRVIKYLLLSEKLGQIQIDKTFAQETLFQGLL